VSQKTVLDAYVRKYCNRRFAHFFTDDNDIQLNIMKVYQLNYFTQIHENSVTSEQICKLYSSL